MCAGDGPKGKNQSDQCGSGCYRVGEQGQRDISIGEALGHNARPDYRCNEKQGAQEFRG
jgi:hypothetical protein